MLFAKFIASTESGRAQTSKSGPKGHTMTSEGASIAHAAIALDLNVLLVAGGETGPRATPSSDELS
jgi:hypothetical protein